LANEYNYGQKGVATDLQFGKRGPRLVANLTTNALQVTNADGSTLNNVRIANAVVSTDAVTKAQLDASVANISTNAYNITLGSGGDGDFSSPGSVTSLDANTTVSESIDRLNETMENIRNNTYVKSVDASTNASSGGNPLSVTLTISSVGNPNRYTIDWGDGDTTTATSDSTPSHTYTDNTNSPYDVVVTAFNNSGSGEGSTASITKTNFITLYTATPVAGFELYTASSGGSALSGNSREINAGETIYLENTTTNSSSATCTYQVNWGDGSANSSVASGAAGDVGQGRLSHTYSNDSGSSTYTITIQQTAHSTADPGEVGSTATDILKVYDGSISAPSGLSSKTITFGESSSGTSPRAAHGFTDNSTEDTVSAGSSVTRITNSSAGATTETSTLSSFAYNGDAGTLTAYIDAADAGAITFDGSDNSGSSGNLTITEESDYQFLSTAGGSTSFSSSLYSPGLYQGFKAKVSANTVALAKGSHSMKLVHSATGNTNIISFLKDDLTSTATVTMSNASLSQASAGTLRYVSGVPYYTNDATLTLAGVEVYDWIGQAYTNQSQVLTIANGTNQESTSGSTINTQYYSYADIDGASTFLNSGVPVADTGKDSGNAYTLGSLTVNVNGGGTGIEQIKGRIINVNGNSPYTELSGKYVQAWNGNSGINEQSISVSDSLGATHDDDGLRITGFSSSADTPAFDSSVNNYTANVWSGAITIAGTQEAVNRFGTLKHFTTDLSGTAYLPTGPDLNTGRSGAQYFTFAFRRSTMANFNITLSGKVSGLFIAAPGTDIDSASGLNGWLDASTTYGGSGTPGSDTGNGGNGSNGCAFTSGDRIIDGTTYSNDSFTMTLGDQNASNSTGNNILVRIKLESGDSLTALSIS
tara:strand:+ start:1849 stop:4476 length:2628 start_codon:yes stop_codon:yes gene_type:complete